MSDFLAAFPSELSKVSDAEDTDSAVAVLREVRSDIVAHLAQTVADHPKETAVLIFAYLQKLYSLEEGSGFTDAAVRDLQQWLFIYFMVHGPLPIPNTPDLLTATRTSSLWQRRDLQLIDALRPIASALKLASYGVSLRVLDKVVTSGELDDESMWVTEVNANIEVDQLVPSADLLAQGRDPVIRHVEREVFGNSVSDVLSVLDDIDQLRRATRVVTDDAGEMVSIDLDGAPSHLQQLFAQFSLTPELLRAHSAPAFFFTGHVANRTDVEIMETAQEMEWLTYAPLLHAAYFHHGEPHRARITSRFLAYRMSGRASSCLAFRLHRAIETMRVRYPNLTPSTRTVVRQYHSYLESTVSRVFVESGMAATQNVTSFAGRPLPCGEVDVLAVGRAADGATVVCVTEVKDTDVSFYKDSGASHAAQTVRRGLEQADRKARWLVENMQLLRETFPEVASMRSARILPLVVTRHTPLPLSAGLPPVVSRYELGSLVSMLLESPLQSWRRDFQIAARSAVADSS
jgi:hypothetical protein